MNKPLNATSSHEATERSGTPVFDVTPASISAYVADFECLMDGVMLFLRLERQVSEDKDMSPIREHYDAHPEDKLCHIYHQGKRRMVLCTRSGINAIHRMTKRLIEEAPNGADLSPKAIAEAMTNHIVQVMLDGVTDDELVRRLKSYVTLTESEHAPITHHIPCVIMEPVLDAEIGGGPPQEKFVLAPVSFEYAPAFIEGLKAEANRDDAYQSTVKYFAEAALEHGWVASITIPSCAPDVSRKRAEDVIESAINTLKVFIGLRYANSMRLPHTSAARDRQTCILSEKNGEYSWTWHGRSREGARVRNDWFCNLPRGYCDLASHLLLTCLSGRKSETAKRVVDALRWFGDASFEESCGVKVSKWIAALERLTTTGHFNTHTFCVRVALLASNLDTTSLDRCYREARTAYQLRCDVMHGSRSQDDEHFAIHQRLVHDLTRTALFRALEMHRCLDATQDPELSTINSFFEGRTKRYEAQFELLRLEFSGKRKDPRN